MQDQEIVTEFLAESFENLARFEGEMIELEQRPNDPGLLASIFRTIHTIKGTCGFLAFTRLQDLAHVTEDLLGEVRDGKRSFDKDLTSLILESVDGIKRMLDAIEATGTEGAVFEVDLIARLERTRDGVPDLAPAPPTGKAPAAPVLEAAAPANSAAEEPSPAPAAAQGSIADSSLRVDVALLDRLMNLVGELVLTRNQVLQCSVLHENPTINAISQRLNLITSELQEGVMKTRMQPIGVVFSKLPRVVRDVSTTLNKDIVLEMDGAGTELDRTIIEAIKDPLVHLIRNACDHGIESPADRLAIGKPGRGRISLRAFHEGGQVNIEITDDGAGIDPQRVKRKALERQLATSEQCLRMSDREVLNLIFLPGFSTAQAVTSISGRGVGMDVVKTHIEKIGGMVDLSSRFGQGTTVRVRIPLTLAIIPGLVVSSGGERFVIPQISLHELIRLEGDAVHKRIEYVHSAPVLRRRDMLLPLADLSQVLGLPSQRPPEETSIVVLQADEQRFGLIVDAISDNQEIVVKPLGQQLKTLNCYAGATIMGDGKIALILDVAGIGQRAGVFAVSVDTAHNGTSATINSSEGDRRTLLLFRSGSLQRIALPLSEVARLEKFPRSRMEQAGGYGVIQYRGHILPLLSLADTLGEMGNSDADELNVIVYQSSRGAVGLVVDEIIDIVEETIESHCGSVRSGLLGSAVIGGRVTDILDVNSVLESAAVPWTGSLERLEAAISGANAVEAEPEVVL